MEPEEIKQLIAYHQAGLDQYRLQMSPSVQRLEERTIDALKELQNKDKRRKEVSHERHKPD